MMSEEEKRRGYLIGALLMFGVVVITTMLGGVLFGMVGFLVGLVVPMVAAAYLVGTALDMDE